MRITGLKIDGFGVWSGLELADLAGDVNVFYGPNEAGKTTLVEFVRSIFYGFSPERRAQYLPPVRGGRPGGAIHLVADGKSCHVSRHADEPGEPSLIVVDQTGHSPEEPLPLSALLGGVPEGIFKNVFVFGLREIQELGSLSDSEAADELYNLALGMDGVSLVGVLDELETSRNRLLARDERPSLIVQLVAQRERLHNEIETLSGQTLRYFTLSAHRERLAGDIRRLEEESVALDHRARELALAASLAERWRRRSELDQRLQAVGSWGAFPADALPRFDRVQSRLQARRLRLTRLKDQRRSLRNQIYQLNIHEPLCREALRLEALAEQQQWIASLETELASLETEIGQLQTEHQESCRRLGISTKAGKAAEDSSSRVLDELRAAARSVAETRRDMRQLTTQATTVGETPEEYRRKLAAALGDAKDKTLTQRLTEAGELVSTLRQRVQLDGRIDQMSRREAELDDEQDGQVEKQMLPGWALGGLGAAFVLGCALVLLFAAGMVLPAPLGSALGWPFGLVGVVMVASASGLKIGLERTAAGQLNSLQSQLQSLSQQMEEAKNERDELDQHLPRSGGPLVARLKTAEGELARLEELLPLEAKRTAAEREAQTVAERLAGRQADHRRARENWRRLVAQFDLPAELKPNDLGEFWRRRGQLRALDQSLASKRDELDRLRSQYETVARRIGQIVLDVGLTPPSGRPLEQLRYCLTELAEQKSRMKRRDELGGQIDRLGRRYSRLRQAIEKLVHRRQLLMKLAGTLDEQEFRRRAAARAEAEGLAAERDHLTQEITAALAGQSTEDRLAAWMSTPQPIDLADAQLAQDRQAHAAELSQALEARGELNQQLKTLLEDRQLGQKRIELGIVDKRLSEAIERWRVLAVCRTLLQSVRDYYEREHQPQALQEASGYLERLTMGRYTRVWTPWGEHALRVDDHEGKSLGVDVLSRGTREQLFLALRLALASAYARKGVTLPLVLDDVLVNFDMARARAAATVLRDFARGGHQILIFTCHEHISKLFKSVKAEVRQLGDNGQTRSMAPADAAPRRMKRTSRDVPAPPPPEDPTPFDIDLDELDLEGSAIAPTIAPVSPVPSPARAPVPVVMAIAPPPPIEPLPAVVDQPPPPVPAPSPPQAPRRRVRRQYEQVPWSAEEFEGELADRVRRDIVDEIAAGAGESTGGNVAGTA